MRGNAELSEWGRESLARAEAVFVGSAHIREVLEDVVGHVERVHEVPPGVDVDEFRPQPRDEALADLLAEARRDPPNPGNANERLPDEGNAERLTEFFASDEPTVLYFGKLMREQGRPPAARGAGRPRSAGRDRRVRRLPRGARGGGTAGTLFTGPLEHRHLVHLLPLCDVAVVPSIFPEAFGMVAAEAAAAGVPAARRTALGPRGDRGRHRGRVPARAPRADELRERRRRRPPRQAAARSWSSRRASELASAAAARATAVSKWSWRSVAGRLLAPFH